MLLIPILFTYFLGFIIPTSSVTFTILILSLDSDDGQVTETVSTTEADVTGSTTEVNATESTTEPTGCAQSCAV